jgi:hypothetical protein
MLIFQSWQGIRIYAATALNLYSAVAQYISYYCLIDKILHKAIHSPAGLRRLDIAHSSASPRSMPVQRRFASPNPRTGLRNTG